MDKAPYGLDIFTSRYGLIFAINALGGSLTITKAEVQKFNEDNELNDGKPMFTITTSETEITITAMLK